MQMETKSQKEVLMLAEINKRHKSQVQQYSKLSFSLNPSKFQISGPKISKMAIMVNLDNTRIQAHLSNNQQISNKRPKNKQNGNNGQPRQHKDSSTSFKQQANDGTPSVLGVGGGLLFPLVSQSDE